MYGNALQRNLSDLAAAGAGELEAKTEKFLAAHAAPAERLLILAEALLLVSDHRRALAMLRKKGQSLSPRSGSRTASCPRDAREFFFRRQTVDRRLTRLEATCVLNRRPDRCNWSRIQQAIVGKGVASTHSNSRADQ